MTQRTLYHFTSSHLLPGILTGGLTKGCLPWSMDAQGRVGMKPGFQWLTEVADWGQEWARPSPHSKLPFRRDEIRLTIRFPDRYVGELSPWPAIDRRHRPASADFLNTFADAPRWWLFWGKIPPPWFTAIDRNPLPPPDVMIDTN